MAVATGSDVAVAVGGAVVAVGAPGVLVAVAGSVVAVASTAVLVAVAGAITGVLVAVGSGGVVAVGSGVGVGEGAAGVEVKVGLKVGLAIAICVGGVAGCVNSLESMRMRTVKTNPLRKTRIPRNRRCFNFIRRPFLVLTTPMAQPSYGITSACPTRIAFGLSSPLAWASSSVVIPYIRAISLSVSLSCTT